MSAVRNSETERRRLAAERLVAGLDPSERLFLHDLLEGMSVGAIAAASGKSLPDAEHTLGSLMKKLNAGTIADAVRIGLYARLARSD
jgi:FixJ family two-component response regulator